MLNTNQEERKLALAITHYAYRNTVLEDYHSDSITMDKSFYKKIYKTVYCKLKNVEKFHKYIKIFHSDTNFKEELEKLLNTVPEENHFKFLRYFNDIMLEVQLNCGVAWDPAEVVDCNINGKSLAHYVLSGCFVECCEKGAILDNATMCYINKDIHNRIYTLLVKGYFD